MCLFARRRRDTVVVVVVVVVVWGVGMVMVMMMRQLGMGHGMVMMVVVVVMMMRSRVVRGWCDLLAGCLRFVFPRSQRLMNGRSISRRMRGMMVVMMMVMVMVRERRRCLLVVMLRLGYTTWLTWHLIGRSGNRHSVRIVMMWYTVYFVWHWRMCFWLTRRLIRDHRAQAHGVLRA